jgi:hypothetical protein
MADKTAEGEGNRKKEGNRKRETEEKERSNACGTTHEQAPHLQQQRCDHGVPLPPVQVNNTSGFLLLNG